MRIRTIDDHGSVFTDDGWIDLAAFAVPPPIAGDFAAGFSHTAVKATVPLVQTLYLQEAGDTAAIGVNDLHQGQIGDCFLISSIGEIAQEKPADIARMIHANADGTETVTLYTGTNGHVAGFGATAFRAVAVKVANDFPTYSVNNGAGQDVANGKKEIWAQVLEKAVATLDGGYGAIAHGGNPMIAMQELTGKAATALAPGQLTASVLQSLITAGDMIVMDTAVGNTTYNLVGSHAYMFEKMTGTGSAAMAQLGNPWGFDQPRMIPVSQLAKAFVEVDIGHPA